MSHTAAFWRVGTLLDAHRKRTPFKPALVDVDRKLSIDFTQLAQCVDGLARQLQREGVIPGTRVVLANGAGAEKLLLWLAIWRLNAIVCPVDLEFIGRLAAQRVFDRINPAFVLVPEHTDPALMPCHEARTLSFDAWSTTSDASQTDLRTGAELADAIHDDDPLPSSNEPGNPQDIAAMCCTSGTTGIPKIIVYSHASYWYNGLDTIELLSLTAEDRTLEYRSFDWYSAQILSLMPFLQLGSTLCVARRFSRSRFAHWVEDHRVTVSAGLPTVLNLLLAKPIDISNRPLRSLRAITCSTAPLSAVQWSRFEKHYGIPVLNLYGSSEAGWICGNRYPQRKFGTVGRPAPHIFLMVLDSGGIPCAVKEPGQVVVAGEKLALGRLNDENELDPIHGAPLETNDVASIDEEGFVTVSGRMDDLIIRGGVKVLPQDIEDILLAHAMVHDAVVIGVPDPIYGQEPVCFVVPTPGSTVDVAELIELCQTSLPREKQPSQIHLITALPRNARGKVIRSTLRREWWKLKQAGGT